MEYKLLGEQRNDLSIIQQLLYNRGITNIETFIDPLLGKENLYTTLDNIIPAAKLLLKTIAMQLPIYIQVDSDCDGYTSAAVLINYLYSVFPSYVETKVTYGLHHKKLHGIDINEIPENTALVIAPDSSSNENDIHKELAQRGIDVIVLDHHIAEYDSTDPALIVNNQMCEYKNKALSGVGVVYKFCQALDDILHKPLHADDYLDLVALGLLGDMMDMREEETRKLVTLGLANVHNPFFVYMCRKNAFSMNNTIDAHGVTWFVVPYINAVTRIGTDKEKQLIFSAMLQHKASEVIPSTKRGHAAGDTELLVEQAVRVCANIKRHQDDEKKEVVNSLKLKIEKEHLADEPVIIIKNINVSDDSPLRGITGLLANTLMSDYGKPTIILNETMDKDYGIIYSGSARGFEVADVRDWRQFIEDSGYAIFAQGHPAAFGCAFVPQNLEAFGNFLKQKFGTKQFEKTYYVDFIWRFNENNLAYKIEEIANYKTLWGQNAPEPLVVIEDIPVNKDTAFYMSKGTLKLQSKSAGYNCLKFSVPLEEYEAILDKRITVVGTCDINEYMGNKTPQIKIVDYMIEQKLPTWSIADF